MEDGEEAVLERMDGKKETSVFLRVGKQYGGGVLDRVTVLYNI